MRTGEFSKEHFEHICDEKDKFHSMLLVLLTKKLEAEKTLMMHAGIANLLGKITGATKDDEFASENARITEDIVKSLESMIESLQKMSALENERSAISKRFFEEHEEELMAQHEQFMEENDESHEGRFPWG